MNDTLGMKTKLTNLPQRRDHLFPQPGEAPKKSVAEKHIYLKVGDKVFHKRFRSWGCGIVMEARASDVPGGLCYVRIQFQDGKKRFSITASIVPAVATTQGLPSSIGLHWNNHFIGSSALPDLLFRV
jgi:hypothetical protein